MRAEGQLAGTCRRRRRRSSAAAGCLLAVLLAVSILGAGASYASTTGAEDHTTTHTTEAVPTTATTGVAQEYDFGLVWETEPSANCKVTIDWGDGTSSPASLGAAGEEGEREVIATHAYAVAGSYEAVQEAAPSEQCPLGARTVSTITVGEFTLGTNTNYNATVFQVTVTDAAVPVLVSPPTISGTAQQGQVLTVSPGTWTNSPTSLRYQWEDCNSTGGECTAITGATGQTYSLAAADVGHTIRVQESALDAGGWSSPAASAPTAVVQAPETPATPEVTAGTGTTTGSTTAGMDPSSANTSAPSLLPPTITQLRESHRVWLEGKASVRISRRKRRRGGIRLHVGTTISFSLNVDAAVTVKFIERLRGHKAKRMCARERRKSRRRRACTRTSTVVMRQFAGHAGVNSLSFQGRVSRSKTLKPGRYTVSVTARTSAGASPPRSLSFTIKQGRRKR